MKIDFNKHIADRRNTHSLKWDVKPNELPMWVADMDFKTAPEIIDVLHKRVDIGAFGYSIIPDEFFASISDYYQKYHHVLFKKEEMIFTTGVVAAISSMVRSLTNVGDNIVVLSPTYNIFYNSILNNKRVVLPSNLLYENEEFIIDWEDLEEKLSRKNTSMLILCNPHNPIGHIWPKEDLILIGELAAKYNVIVISDEIHCDLCDPGYEYNSFGLNEVNRNISVTCIAASKTFNLAGLQAACIIIPNEDIRKKADRGFNNDEVAESNFFAIDAYITAYSKCRYYVDELNEYLYQNKQYVREFLKERFPNLLVVSGHATYLMWIDISYYGLDSVTFTKRLREQTGLFVNDGLEYGKNGDNFIRINLATSLKNVKEACIRLEQFIKRID